MGEEIVEPTDAVGEGNGMIVRFGGGDGWMARARGEHGVEEFNGDGHGLNVVSLQVN